MTRGELVRRPHGEGVLQQLRRIGLQHLTVDKNDARAIRSDADPVHGTAGLQLDFEFCAAKDDVVRLFGDEAFPDFLRGRSDVEDEVQGGWMGHARAPSKCTARLKYIAAKESRNTGRDMKSYKTMLISALVAAPVGLVFALFHLRDRLPHVTFFMMDPTMKAHWNLVWAGILVFVIFGVYWEIAAKSASKAVTSESKASRSVHVTLTNVAFLMELVPIRGIGRFIPAKPGVMMAAIAVEVIGLLIAVWARRHLGKHWSGEITIKEGHELIRTGPYRKLRHPIYTGILTMYVGAMLLTGEWLGVIGLALGFFAYARKIRLEEKNLAKGFGEQYEAYRKESWAVFPGLW